MSDFSAVVAGARHELAIEHVTSSEASADEHTVHALGAASLSSAPLAVRAEIGVVVNVDWSAETF